MFYPTNSSSGALSLQGTLSGSEMSGLLQGTLTESTPGNGVYDHFTAEWRLNRIQGGGVSSTLYCDGTLLTVDEQLHASVPLTVIQTSMEGTTFGDYEESLSTVLTHVHVSDPAKSFNGSGFSTFSYSSAEGPGQGWTYDTLTPDFIDLKGRSTRPLEGVVSGTLLPQTLSLAIERMDRELPPTSDLSVAMLGPGWISPGQTITYTVRFQNEGYVSASKVPIILELPETCQYRASSDEGVYYAASHEIEWVKDTISPRQYGYLSARCTFDWGLQPNDDLIAYAYIPHDTIVIEKDPTAEIEILESSPHRIVLREFNVTSEGIAIIELKESIEESPREATWDYSVGEEGTVYRWNYSIETNSYSWRDVEVWIDEHAEDILDVADHTEAFVGERRRILERQQFLDWLVNHCLIGDATRKAQMQVYTSFHGMTWARFVGERLPILGDWIDGIYLQGLDAGWIRATQVTLKNEIRNNLIPAQEECGLPRNIRNYDQIYAYYLTEISEVRIPSPS
jgi:hypothetical protein